MQNRRRIDQPIFNSERPGAFPRPALAPRMWTFQTGGTVVPPTPRARRRSRRKRSPPLFLLVNLLLLLLNRLAHGTLPTHLRKGVILGM